MGSVVISIGTFPQRLKPHWREGAYATDESVPFQSRMKLEHYWQTGFSAACLALR